jgi:hypothetical protein
LRIHRLALFATPLLSGCFLAAALGLGTQALELATTTGVAAGGAAANRADEERDQSEKCELLVAAQPYVSQVRLNQDGTIELRQWHIDSQTGSPKWEILRLEGSDAQGWRTESEAAAYNFQPPLQTQFNGTQAPYLISVRAEASNSTESEQELGTFAVFGTPTGVYDWRGVRYHYTVVSTLPCYPQEKEP